MSGLRWTDSATTPGSVNPQVSTPPTPNALLALLLLSIPRVV